jgi:phosphatidate cytidylyltransferase
MTSGLRVRLLLTAGICLGRAGVTLLLVVASVLAVREFIRITGLDRSDRSGTLIVFGALALHYAFIGCVGALAVMPVAVVLIIGAWQATSGRTRGYVRSTASLCWAWAVFVYAPAHALLWYMLPEDALGSAGPGGALLCLLMLTSTNDIAQALIGRRIGRFRITPTVSPHKTWEGFAGGVAVTALLGAGLAPVLTPLARGAASGTGALTVVGPHAQGAALGALLAVAGFFGDINISAVKRDAGVKDGSTLLPGQGGMIDRIDSLSFTAPVFITPELAVRLVSRHVAQASGNGKLREKLRWPQRRL